MLNLQNNPFQNIEIKLVAQLRADVDNLMPGKIQLWDSFVFY